MLQVCSSASSVHGRRILETLMYLSFYIYDYLSVITVCVALNVGNWIFAIYTKELMLRRRTCVQAILLPLSQLRFTHLSGGEYQVRRVFFLLSSSSEHSLLHMHHTHYPHRLIDCCHLRNTNTQPNTTSPLLLLKNYNRKSLTWQVQMKLLEISFSLMVQQLRGK